VSLRGRARGESEPLATRFERHYEPEPMSGCWLWTASRNGDGYGFMTVGSRGIDRSYRGAHRVSYEIYVGPIPDGMCVLHRCDVPACVNPAHLFLGTQRDNALDRERKHRGRYAKATQ